jgi:hypothetical protein
MSRSRVRLALRLSCSLIVPLLVEAGCDDEKNVGSNQQSLTFWGDIAPIFNEKCVKCHQPGGIGPFRLDDYGEASKMAPAISVAVESKTMPPYLVAHDGTCGQFEDGETLTAEQITKIKTWATGQKTEGTKGAFTPSQISHLTEGTDYKTPTLAPVPMGGKLAEFDEYRCFPVETALEADKFITGYEVTPGNAAIVHHVVAFVIDPEKKPEKAMGKTNAELMKALDDSDPDRVGWPCFGLAGEGVEIDSIPVVWAPGQGTVNYPSKMGVRHRKTDKLVIQLHYNLSDPKLAGQTDSTTVRLRYTDSVDRRMVFVLKDGFLETLYNQNQMPAVLLPGMASVKYSWKSSFAELGFGQLPGIDLVGVMPHMHQRGRKKEMTLIDGAGQSSCAARVDRWDFNWQKFYFYKTPPQITPTTQIQLSCEYDTSKETAPVLPGWGTRNEMCIAILMLALPPGL